MDDIYCVSVVDKNGQSLIIAAFKTKKEAKEYIDYRQRANGYIVDNDRALSYRMSYNITEVPLKSERVRVKNILASGTFVLKDNTIQMKTCYYVKTEECDNKEDLILPKRDDTFSFQFNIDVSRYLNLSMSEYKREILKLVTKKIRKEFEV